MMRGEGVGERETQCKALRTAGGGVWWHRAGLRRCAAAQAEKGRRLSWTAFRYSYGLEVLVGINYNLYQRLNTLFTVASRLRYCGIRRSLIWRHRGVVVCGAEQLRC